ncbi:hypothetical protein [Streptomyces sp. NPDC059258]|uniref:hypothetical protein n=1 Tax=unclassified Streptomyces TaxID=2593676 RepID=UPI0036BDACFA
MAIHLVLSEDTMALSHIARLHAAEIRNHDWSDAPFRADRAGHDRADDGGRGDQLTQPETDNIRMNVMWVTAQVLGYQDPNFDVYEFAEACGVETRTRSGRPDGTILAGIRLLNDRYARPGTRDYGDRY